MALQRTRSRRWARPAAAAIFPALALLACDHVAPEGDAVSVPAAAAAVAAEPERFAVPAASGAMAPELTAGPDGVVLSWLEPAAAGEERLALRAARWTGDGWDAPRTVVHGDDFFANWADRPAVVAAADGLYAHWLRKLGEDTYAYGVEVARSTDDGATWTPLGLLHDDASESEHGFVTLVPSAGGGIRAVYLDGRATGSGAPMQLRAARLDADGAAPSELLDDAVCDCCATDAVAPGETLVVAYRDRSAEEIRDIAVVRDAGGGWSEPRRVAADDWEIPGCPVNGPAVDAAGERVALAWFTAADGAPRVLVAFSDDGGVRFGAARTVDDSAPLGRVDLVAGDDGSAFVVWLATGDDGGAAVRLQRFAADGTSGEPRDLAPTDASRAAGVPRMVRDGARVVVAWVGADGIATAALPLAAL